MNDIEPTPSSPVDARRRGSWWRRNRVWLAVLVPLAVLALLATSFRLQKIYLPWYWTRPHVAQGSTMTFEQIRSYSDGLTIHRVVGLSVVSVAPASVVEDAVAVPGGVMWRVEIRITANPDVMLQGCQVWLEGSDGTVYDSGTAGKTEAPDGYLRFSVQCVPEDAPGPTIALDGKTVKPGEIERPASWTIVAGVVLPAGLEPTKVRIGWSEPDYAVLDVPR